MSAVNLHWAAGSVCLAIAMMVAFVSLAVTVGVDLLVGLFMVTFAFGLGGSAIGLIVSSRPLSDTTRDGGNE